MPLDIPSQEKYSSFSTTKTGLVCPRGTTKNTSHAVDGTQGLAKMASMHSKSATANVKTSSSMMNHGFVFPHPSMPSVFYATPAPSFAVMPQTQRPRGDGSLAARQAMMYFYHPAFLLETSSLESSVDSNHDSGASQADSSFK
jgi:hypothetical protein